MADFWQRINPTGDEIDQALADARPAGVLDRPTAPERQAALAQATSSAGALGWGAAPTTERAFDRVTCAWWTDALGRKHWYVEGGTYSLHGEPSPRWRCRDGVPLHPLWVIAPRHVFCRGASADALLLVVCDCGAVGTPEAVGWTGGCCGPCFDRHAEGAGWVVPPPLAISPRGVAGISFTEDGRVVSCDDQGDLCLYDPRTGQDTRLPAAEGGPVGLTLLPDDRVVVAYVYGEVVCWDLSTGEQLWASHCRGELMGVAASPLGDLVAVDAVGQTYLLDAATGEGNGLSSDYAEFAFSHDGEVLYTFDHDPRCVVAIDPITEEATETGLEFGEPEEDDCYSLACHPRRPLLASGGDNGRVRLGDLTAGRWLWVNDGPAGLVSHLAFTPDGQTLATGHDNLIVFWDVDTGSQRAVLRISGYGVAGLAFNADGETLAFGDEQGVVRVWPWRRLV